MAAMRALRRFLELSLLIALSSLTARGAERPNVLWITSEDNGPELGCYGDTYAVTPNIDSLAAKGLRYLHAWSNAPVCAPARTTLISGLYPPSTGSQHMRSQVRLPEGFKMYPQYLREAGYYCTNHSKEDYNLIKPGQVWDASDNQAHWKNRREDQPFFAIFNHTDSHESQIRTRPHQAVHDPAEAPVPAYHPDTPEVRQDWAQYYDKLTEMDAKVGANLKELEEAGLTEDTIVFYYGDHGSGMPRSKRWPYNSGLHVPLIVFIPEKFKHLAPEDYRAGGTTDRLVSFVDLAPTLLSLVGVPIPEHFHGHAFLGPADAGEPPYLYGFRGRMDERIDCVRVVRDQRYLYIRNYMPHKPYGQHVSYMFQTPATQVWKALHDEGKLDEAQSAFWRPKPAEELYDLEVDPDEVHNLAYDPAQRSRVAAFREVQEAWARRIRDLGFLPEDEIHERAGDDAPYVMARDPERYPQERILSMAEMASSLAPGLTDTLIEGCRDDDSAVRFWAASGLLMRGKPAVAQGRETLLSLLKDPAVSPRVAAAEALGLHGRPEDLEPVMETLLDLASLENQSLYTSIYALNAIDVLGEKARPWKDRIAALPDTKEGTPNKLHSYVPRLLEKIRGDLIR